MKINVSLTSVLCLSALVFLSLPVTAQILHLDANDAGNIAVNGSNEVTSWTNSAGGQVFSSSAGRMPLLVNNAINGLSAVRFDGVDDVLRSLTFNDSASELTLFIVAAPHSNAGSYRALLSGTTTGTDDFTNGINIDLTGNSSSSFDRLNLEGAKGGGGGGVNLRTGSDPFDTFKIISITYGSSTPNQLYINGVAEGNRAANANAVSLQEMRVGGRFYAGSETGYLDGDIAEVFVYDTLLSDPARQGIEQQLTNKYFTVVPEPGTLALALTGLASVALLRSRRYGVRA